MCKCFFDLDYKSLRKERNAYKGSFTLIDCTHAPPIHYISKTRHESVRVNMCVWRGKKARNRHKRLMTSLLLDIRWANMKLKWKSFTEGWQQHDQRVFIGGETCRCGLFPEEHKRGTYKELDYSAKLSLCQEHVYKYVHYIYRYKCGGWKKCTCRNYV